MEVFEGGGDAGEGDVEGAVLTFAHLYVVQVHIHHPKDIQHTRDMFEGAFGIKVHAVHFKILLKAAEYRGGCGEYVFEILLNSHFKEN